MAARGRRSIAARVTPQEPSFFQRLFGGAQPEGPEALAYAIERLVDWLGMQMPSLFLATGFCTSREWEFLGLSMANWSTLFFAGIAGYAILLFRSKARA